MHTPMKLNILKATVHTPNVPGRTGKVVVRSHDAMVVRWEVIHWPASSHPYGCKCDCRALLTAFQINENEIADAVPHWAERHTHGDDGSYTVRPIITWFEE